MDPAHRTIPDRTVPHPPWANGIRPPPRRFRNDKQVSMRSCRSFRRASGIWPVTHGSPDAWMCAKRARTSPHNPVIQANCFRPLGVRLYQIPDYMFNIDATALISRTIPAIVPSFPLYSFLRDSRIGYDHGQFHCTDTSHF